MHISEIEVGKTYVNKGAGRTFRKVLAIGHQYLPSQCHNAVGKFPAGVEIGVLYSQKRRLDGKISLKSFAAWAGKEVL